MNTIYSLVWNLSIRALVVGSEFAKRARKSGCARKLACVAMLAAANGAAFAQSGHLTEDLPLCNEAHVAVAESGDVACKADTTVEAASHDVVGAPAKTAGAGRVIDETYVSMTSSGAAAVAAANKDAMALGGGTEAMGTHSVALGSSAKAMAQDTMALGYNSRATATGGVAIGGGFVSKDKEDTAAGSGGMYGIAIGSGARVEMDYLGEDYQSGIYSGAENGVAIGRNSWAAGKNSVAIGANAEALEDYTVSIGSNGIRRRLVNVADGTYATDAVTIQQADAMLGIFGGNARFEDGVLVAPSFTVQNQSHDTVYDAIEALDQGIVEVNDRIDNIDTGAGDSGLIVAEDGVVKIGASSTATEIDFSRGAAARTLKGVADGDVKARSTEAVNGGQLYATNKAVSANKASIVTNTTNIATNTTKISGLAGRVDTVDATLKQHDATLGGHTDLIKGLTTELENTNDRIDNIDTGAGDSGLIAVEGDAVKIGASSTATEIDFSRGAAARTLKGVADGDVKARSTEAVNGGQLYTTNEAVSVNKASIVTNTANIATNTTKISGLAGRVDTVDLTLTRHDSRMDGLAQDIKATNDRIDGFPGTPGAPGDQLIGEGADGSLFIGANVGGSLVNMAGSAGDRVLTGVAGGRVEAHSNDAVNGHQVAEIRDQLEKEIGTIGDRVSQIEQGEVAPPTAPAPGDGDYVSAAQLEEQMGQAKSYTDSRMDALNGSIDTLRQDVDARFKAQDQRISRIGAMGAAMTQMTSSMAATRGENRVGAGIGTQGGQRAISVGYQRVVEKANAAITIGGSFSNGESQAGVGIGFGF